MRKHSFPNKGQSISCKIYSVNTHIGIMPLGFFVTDYQANDIGQCLKLYNKTGAAVKKNFRLTADLLTLALYPPHHNRWQR
jgi:hypothetical protein